MVGIRENLLGQGLIGRVFEVSQLEKKLPIFSELVFQSVETSGVGPLSALDFDVIDLGLHELVPDLLH